MNHTPLLNGPSSALHSPCLRGRSTGWGQRGTHFVLRGAQDTLKPMGSSPSLGVGPRARQGTPHLSCSVGAQGWSARTPGGPDETGLDPCSSSDHCLGDTVSFLGLFSQMATDKGDLNPAEIHSLSLEARPLKSRGGLGGLPLKPLGRVLPAVSGSQGSWCSLPHGHVPTSLLPSSHGLLHVPLGVLSSLRGTPVTECSARPTPIWSHFN